MKKNTGQGKYDYSYEERTTIPEAIAYLVADAIFITEDYLIRAATFLPKKGLEMMTSLVCKTIDKAKNIEDKSD